MDSIKYETETRLENIFISIDKTNTDKLDILLKDKDIDTIEKTKIRKLKDLVGRLDKAPSLTILKQEFPDMYFESTTKYDGDGLSDYIKLYLVNKKNILASSKLLSISSKVKTEGLTPDIINSINQLTKSDIVSISHYEVMDHILEIYDKKIPDSGIKTGVKRIDEDTGGLQPGTITTILGFTGSFKTTWALNIAYNAKLDNKNVLYLSLEVIKENIVYNILSRHSYDSKFNKHIEHLSLKHKKLKPDEKDYFDKEIYPDFMKTGGKIYTIDETELENYSYYSLETKFVEIDKVANKETGHGIDLLVIDHAQLLKFDASMKSLGNETNVVNAYVSFFRQTALNWIKSGKQIAVLMLSQSSRTGWQEAAKSEGRYRLTALAEANELERASSVVLSVFSSESLKQIKSAKVQILKNRDGQAWSEPMEVFVDPVYYMFGDNNDQAIENSTEFNMENLSGLLNSDNKELDNLIEDIDIDNINLNLGE